MYCPKCKDTFEVGSRRFCPTDGARLISETENSGDQGGGIFANLIPKIETRKERDEVLSDVPRFVVTEPSATPVESKHSANEKDDMFFQFDPPEAESSIPRPMFYPDFPKSEESDEIVTRLANSGSTQPIEPDEVSTRLASNANSSRFVEQDEVSTRLAATPVSPRYVEPDEVSTRLAPNPAYSRPTDRVMPSDSLKSEEVPGNVRKVNPYDIPKGHVDLENADRPVFFGADVDENDPDTFVGRVVKGRYKVTEFLGDDETGLAYLADDKLVEDKKVLVRVLLDEGSDEIMDSILAEERVSLSHFSHPNIARLIDSGQFTNGSNFLISEFVDALSVADILSIHGHFKGPRAARIIKQTASALNEAHQEGIIHRDVRPENLIISPGEGDAEQTKLVNFGVSDGEPTTQNFLYKAPEVLDGRISTTASDIYSLAVVAYEMVTGSLPFAGERAKDVVRAQTGGLAVLPSAIRVGLTADVDKVFTRALAYSTGNRYPKARDFGEALAVALTGTPRSEEEPEKGIVLAPPAETFIELKPLVPDLPPIVPIAEKDHRPKLRTPILGKPKGAEPAWKNRSPEPPQEGNQRTKILIAAGLLALLGVLVVGSYFMFNRPPDPGLPGTNGEQTEANANSGTSSGIPSTEMPPFPRTIPQPANTNFYQNSKQNLRGDLLLNFVGFTMYYPKDWKVNGPQVGTSANARGKFIDISKSTPDGRLREQMLVSYYPSKGTFTYDSEKFPQMVKEANETLKKILPDYQMVSEGEIRLNGDWRAYEMKFQAVGKSTTGEKLVVWGRRLFIPAARPGIRNGFEITLIATSLADDVHSAEDVGRKGELGPILETFEPSQNF